MSLPSVIRYFYMYEPLRNRGNRSELPPQDLLLDGRGEGEIVGPFHLQCRNLCRRQALRLKSRPPGFGGKQKARTSRQTPVESRTLAACDDRRLPLAMTRRRFGGELQEVKAAVRPGYFNLIDLRFFIPSCDFEQTPFLAAVSRAVESVLGKKTFARWIGDVDAEPLAADDSGLLGLEELPAAVCQMIEDAQAAMPDRPWHELERGEDWLPVEYEPDEAADYPDQRDLIAGISVIPWMWQNAISAIPFDSARHSRCGERFCYLKMDCTSGWNHAKFADREEIEQALDASLRRGRLGSVVGGGAGLRYSYIELALADVTRAWREIREVLLEGRLPKRTWLLFHDAAISARWLGLYDDTPQPPRRREG